MFKTYKIVLISKHERQVFWFEKNPVTIGRSKDCDLSFIGDGVSRQHIKVEFLDGDLYITDLGSKNGTFYNGEQVYPEERFKYRQGASVYLGNSHEKFQIHCFQEGDTIEKDGTKFENLFDRKVEEVKEKSSAESFNLEIINPAKIREADKKKNYSKLRRRSSDQSVSSRGHTSALKELELELNQKKNELAHTTEELRNAKAQLHQKLKAMDLEIENRKLELEAKFNKYKNEIELEMMKLEKQLAIKRHDAEIESMRDGKTSIQDAPDLPQQRNEDDDLAS